MRYFKLFAIGAVFGFALSRMGFSSWGEVHAMFTFRSFRLTGAFVAAVVLIGLASFFVERVLGQRVQWAPRRLHPGVIPGSLLFGAGWALVGACPSIALVQLGEGQWHAALTLGGIFLGNWLYSVVHERYFRWSATSCIES